MMGQAGNIVPFPTRSQGDVELSDAQRRVNEGVFALAYLDHLVVTLPRIPARGRRQLKELVDEARFMIESGLADMGRKPWP